MSSGSLTGIIRILPAFLAGMFSGMNTSFSPWNISLILVFILTLLFCSVLFIHPQKKYSYRWINGLLLNSGIFTCAVLMALLTKEIRNPSHFSNFNHLKALSCKVLEDPVVKGKNLRFEAVAEDLLNDKGWYKVSGKILVYIRQDSSGRVPSYGDIILIRKNPFVPEGPKNPGAFDFKRWLEHKEIYHQVFLKNSEWILLGEKKGNPLMQLAIELRSMLMQKISASGISGREKAVLCALILGQDDEIDTELRSNYAVAGVMHILAVSGMHVGLIYAALQKLLRFPGRRKKMRWTKTFILMACLWFYAMLTGLSPSVLRATTMLSFLILGTSLGRASNPVNVIAASGIFLFVVFGPSLIFSAGFQLSYLAVIGILFLYKPLHACWEAPNWLLAQIWSILSVSLVAQLATFPLSIYYFNRFPNYFLLSNLLVIPCGTMVIFGGIFLLLFSWFAPLSVLIGKVEILLLKLLNNSVDFLAGLPGAGLDGLNLNIAELVIIYFIVLMICLFLMKRRVTYLFLLLTGFISFFSIKIFDSARAEAQQFWILFYNPGHMYMQFWEGTEVLSLTDSTILNDQKLRKSISDKFYAERKGRSELIIKPDELNKIYSLNNFIQIKFPFIDYYSEKIFCLNAKSMKIKPLHPVDKLIVMPDAKPEAVQWPQNIQCKLVILSAGMPRQRLNEWKKTLAKLEIEYYDMSEQGAFIEELQ